MPRRLESVAMRECPECRRWIKHTDLVRHYRKKHPEKMVKLISKGGSDGAAQGSP